jgi:primosomal protein N' (replication factor Y)
VGPRSALFAPFPDLGLIVIDECHDGSYDQEEFQPHYHSVIAAIEYAQKLKAVLLMGSATPSVEMLYEFTQNKWNVFHLPQRILAHQPGRITTELMEEIIPESPGNLPLPAIQVVDMRAELVAGNRSALSRSLSQELKGVLAQKEQAILFLNRRGSASYVFCRDCGTVLRCPRCNTQLTFHANEASLRCHLCNYTRLMPKTCPTCGGKNIRQFGMGTESLEKVVSEQFPDARILRWDADTTRFKGAHDLILDHFINQRADILIGTQMLAKGLDLPHVTLVGVILADISLNLPDFRATEKSFQLLTQVAGRAGRSARGGKVVLQTFNPDHYVIRKAAVYDFEGFKESELEYRKKTGYPPFSRLIKLEFRHMNPTYLESEVLPISEKLSTWMFDLGMKSTSMIGPVPCFYERRGGQYRWQILLRGPDPGKLIREHPVSEWQPHGLDVDLVVDPIDLL